MNFAQIDWLQFSVTRNTQHPSKSEKSTFSIAEAAHVLGTTQAIIHRLIARKTLTPLPGIRRKRLPKIQVRQVARGAIITELL